MANPDVRVIGGGLAGCEAAWQLANAGYAVELVEMKPEKRTPAQVSDKLAELVCSNSFRSNAPTNAVGLIKEEMRRLGGFMMRCAEEAKVPAGDALAVDRDVFSDAVERELDALENLTRVGAEVDTLPTDGVLTIVATGPLTADALAADIVRVVGKERLAFYDAIAPIIDADSVDMTSAFFKSRYDKGEGTDYLNCPMTAEEYDRFLALLAEADQADAHEFENLKYFEGCLPIEVLASRGPKTLSFGPLKPVGLEHPDTGERYAAVLQLRKENVHGTSFNMVGCQTRMKQPAQRAVFRSIPALKEAKFLRYGAIHRNTYLDSPAVLDERLSLGRSNPAYAHVHFAGQITGVEGYVESIACGLLVSMIVREKLGGARFTVPPAETALGGLFRHVTGALMVGEKAKFEPSNVTWAMMPPVGKRRREKKHERRARASQRALDAVDAYVAELSD